MSEDSTPQITPTPIAPGTRRATLASTRLLHEWSATQPWDAQPIYELRLGPTVQSVNGAPITPAIEAMLRNANYYADLVGTQQGELWVVEAKVVASFGSLGQLEGYVSLVPSTPSLHQFLNKPVRPVLLAGVSDSGVAQLALNKGIRLMIYSPNWINEYLTAKHFRRRSFARVESEGE